MTSPKESSPSEDLLRAALENSLDGISIIGMDGRPLYVSPSIATLVGYSREEGLTHDIFSLVHPDDLLRAREKLKFASEHPGLGMNEIFRYQHKNGSWRTLEVIGKCEFLKSFNAFALILNYRDITDRLNAELNLKESESRFRRVFEQSPMAMVIGTPSGILRMANPKFCQILGRQLDELIDRSIDEFTHPEDITLDQESFKRFTENHAAIYETEKRYSHKDGRWIWGHLVISKLGSETINGDLIFGMMEDITEQKRANDLDLRLSDILRHTPDAIISGDLKGVITGWNQGAEQMFGYRSEEIVGQSVASLVPPEKTDEHLKIRERCERGETIVNYELTRRRKNGEVFPASVTFSPIRDSQGQLVGVTSITRDITEKIQSDKTLMESEARFRRIFENSPFGMALSTPGGIMKVVNPHLARMLGYAPYELAGRSFAEITYPEDVPANVDGLQRMIRGEIPTYEMEKRYLHKDGRIVWAHMIVTLLGKDKVDEDLFFLAMVEDITEKKKVREISERLSMILEHTPYGIISEDLNGIIRDWNKAAEKMFGYRIEEIIGQSASKLAALDKENEQEALCDMVRKGETVAAFETQRRKKTGEIIDVMITLSPVKDTLGQVTGMAVITRDISDHKRTEKTMKEQEERLLQAQKMEAVGRLAGGVAHDFNNLLSVIGANTGFILTDGGPNPHQEELEEIAKAVKQGAELTKQLLLLGQKQVSQANGVQLNDLCRETHRMLKRLFDASIELNLDLDPDLKPIYADPAQIQQVILNLALNAQDAMPKGGRLSIQTRNETSPNGDFLPGFGPWVKLSVTDTGTGIEPETQKHVYEPFFTTKKGKGTGLGLTTVYGIVKQWKGQIHLWSTPGVGAVFSLFFPAHSAEAETKVRPPRQESLIPDGTETVLVAEDEAPVRKAIARTLSQHGYNVLEACDGLEAIQESWNYKNEIHLLLTDTVMPKLNGRHLAEELSRSRPKTKVLFISGYPRDILSQKGEIDPGIRLLTKPFAMEDLVREVRQVLDENTV